MASKCWKAPEFVVLLLQPAALHGQEAVMADAIRQLGITRVRVAYFSLSRHRGCEEERCLESPGF